MPDRNRSPSSARSAGSEGPSANPSLDRPGWFARRDRAPLVHLVPGSDL